MLYDPARGNPGAMDGKTVFMSTSTDPYQPVEKDLRITRQVMEALTGRPRQHARPMLAPPTPRLAVRVKPTPGTQLALFTTYGYHAFITDRDGDTPALEADHRRHAEIENAIRDLKYGVGLNHLPSGRFSANAAWLASRVMAHNLARRTARIALGEPVSTTKTLRRRFFSLAGRLTRKARRLTRRLPQGWPWRNQFSNALDRLRTLPLPS